MTILASEKTVGEFASANPAAARAFEKLGIDYCCGGRRTLAQACHAAGVTPEAFAAAIEAEARTAPQAADRDWTAEPLVSLMGHIRSRHHAFTRAEIARLAPLFDKVIAAHGARHPELALVRNTFAALAAELFAHLMKEEIVLFPFIERMEESLAGGSPVPMPPFGTMRNPVAMMAAEHDGAGEALRQMREASHGYSAPPDACASFRALFEGLAGFEADLHRHIHLENNILFPRAIEMERLAVPR